MAAVPTTSVKHRFSKPWDESDVIFVVEEEEFHCHYAVVKLNSSVLAAMVGSNSKGGEKRAVLADKKINEFLFFLNLMYPLLEKLEPTPDRSLLLNILKYCKEYQATSVKIQVDHIFATRLCSTYDDGDRYISTALKDLQTAEENNLEQTRNVCAGYLSRAEIWSRHVKNIPYKGFSIETKYQIVMGQLRKFSLHCEANANVLSEQLAFDRSDGTWQLLQTLANDLYK